MAAVTLRAIARELGITAPALYRYFSSRDCLLHALSDDICAELAVYIRQATETVHPANVAGRCLEPSRAFRRWSLTHPREFELVFASGPLDDEVTEHPAHDPFSRLFTGLVAQALLDQGVVADHIDSAELPSQLVPDLAAFTKTLAETLRDSGDEATAAQLTPGLAYQTLRWWIRLYGQVTLEVLDRYPFPVSNRELLFEQTLREVAVAAGVPLED
jgi:AcrR family transcriptional regulator